MRLKLGSAIIFLLGLFIASDALAQSVTVSTNAVERGQTVVASWSGFSGDVNVEVWKGSTKWTDAITNAPGNSSLNLVTTGWELRSDYWVKVLLRSNTTVNEGFALRHFLPGSAVNRGGGGMRGQALIARHGGKI